MSFNRDPKTKADIIDRMLRRDFDGDLSKLGENGQVLIDRKASNVVALKFQNSGEVYELTVHKRRDQPTRRPAAKKAAPAPANDVQAPAETKAPRRQRRAPANQAPVQQ